MNKKLFIIGTLVSVLVISAVGYWSITNLAKPDKLELDSEQEERAEETVVKNVTSEVIGRSVIGRDISVTSFGNGEKHLLFVGGIHGGYEWNSALLAYQMIDYLTNNPELIPADIKISIIPNLNPDGIFTVTGIDGKFSLSNVKDTEQRVAAARFNANKVDLNRNFACKWTATSTWRGEEVSAGTAAFSEPETIALRDFVAKNEPTAVVFWHSQADNVYGSECEEGILADTITLMKTYAGSAGYGEVEKFDAYPITGDAEGWLASIGIPAVTVELKTYNSTEWPKNLAGTMAVIKQYSTAK